MNSHEGDRGRAAAHRGSRDRCPAIAYAGPMGSDLLREYESTSFGHEGVVRPVFLRGAGPGIVVMHEIPGIYPAVIEFGDRLVAAGYRV